MRRTHKYLRSKPNLNYILQIKKILNILFDTVINIYI